MIVIASSIETFNQIQNYEISNSCCVVSQTKAFCQKVPLHTLYALFAKFRRQTSPYEHYQSYTKYENVGMSNL